MYTLYALRYITVYMRIYENSTTIFVNTCFSPRHQKPQKVICFESVSLFLPCLFFPQPKNHKKSQRVPDRVRKRNRPKVLSQSLRYRPSSVEITSPEALGVGGGWWMGWPWMAWCGVGVTKETVERRKRKCQEFNWLMLMFANCRVGGRWIKVLDGFSGGDVWLKWYMVYQCISSMEIVKVYSRK